jgi:hypothetical protein
VLTPIGTLPARSNSHARALPTIQRMAVARPMPTIHDMAYRNRASIQNIPFRNHANHIEYGLQLSCQPYSIWHEHPKGWHGICSLQFPCHNNPRPCHIIYGWHKSCFSATPMPVQGNPPHPTSPPDRREHSIHGAIMVKTNLLFERFLAPINSLKLRQ